MTSGGRPSEAELRASPLKDRQNGSGGSLAPGVRPHRRLSALMNGFAFYSSQVPPEHATIRYRMRGPGPITGSGYDRAVTWHGAHAGRCQAALEMAVDQRGYVEADVHALAPLLNETRNEGDTRINRPLASPHLSASQPFSQNPIYQPSHSIATIMYIALFSLFFPLLAFALPAPPTNTTEIPSPAVVAPEGPLLPIQYNQPCPDGICLSKKPRPKGPNIA
jgi:hypothetical protein